MLYLGLHKAAHSDQLIKRRGKAGLLSLNKDVDTSYAWVEERAGKPVTVSLPIWRSLYSSWSIRWSRRPAL